MAEKRVSVRLAAVGGRQVRAELEGVGEAGSRGFGRLSREMEAANARLAAFSRRVRVVAAAAVAAAAAAGVAMIRSGLQTVDAQAKLAQSLGTTVASIQTLKRAGELAGVSISGIEQATKDLTRRLSQAAAGSGPAADALDRLGLSANELIALPLDQRVGVINAAIESFVPAAERAAVAGQLFGEEGSIAMSRIDTATLRQATEDVLAFGVVVSEQDADQIERTNDAISRLGLIWRGLSNQLAVAAAPALEAVANAMAAVASRTGPLGIAIRGLFDNIGRLTTYAVTFATFLAGRWVTGLAAAALSVRGFVTALVVLRGALIRTGIGALIVGVGELIYQLSQFVARVGRVSVLDRDLTAPPGSPADGDRYIVGSGATGDWAGWDLNVALWADGAWLRLPPRTGWRVWVEDQGLLLVYDGSGWIGTTPTALQNMALLGVGTTADASNPFSAKLNAALWTAKTVAEGGTGDLFYTMNKEAAGDDLGLTLQTGFVTKALVGLFGSDRFRLAVSADGSTFFDGLSVDNASGIVDQPRLPRFKAWTNYDNYVGVGTWTKIGLNNTDYNDQGAFDAANNRFVAPVDGTYLFGATLLYKINASATARMRGRLVLNGATEIRGSLGEVSATHVSLATAIWLQTMVPLTAGDTVELQGYFRVANGYFAADQTCFWGCKIG